MFLEIMPSMLIILFSTPILTNLLIVGKSFTFEFTYHLRGPFTYHFGGQGLVNFNDESSTCSIQSVKCLPSVAGVKVDGSVPEMAHHGITTKRSTKRLKHTGNLCRNNLHFIDVCQF